MTYDLCHGGHMVAEYPLLHTPGRAPRESTLSPPRCSHSAMGLRCRGSRDSAVLSTSPGPPAIPFAEEYGSKAVGVVVYWNGRTPQEEGGYPPPLDPPPPPPLPMFEADSQNFASAPSVPRGFTLQTFSAPFSGDHRGRVPANPHPPSHPPPTAPCPPLLIHPGLGATSGGTSRASHRMPCGWGYPPWKPPRWPSGRGTGAAQRWLSGWTQQVCQTPPPPSPLVCAAVQQGKTLNYVVMTVRL